MLPVLRALALSLRGPSLRYADFAWFDYEQPLVIAHRGGSLLRPENTLPAFEHAAGLGVMCFETDIHRTKDGVLVVAHDDVLDRCTSGRGKIADLTLAEIQQYDAGWHWTPDGGKTYPWRDRGVTLMPLRELFERFPNHRYVIDSKPPDPEVALQLAQLSVECGMADKVCLASFHLDNVLAIRERYPQIVTSATEPEVQAFWAAQFFRWDALCRTQALALQVPPQQYGVKFVDERFVRKAHEHGMHVHVWTIDEAEEMRRLLALGVDGIVTDRPDVMMDLLKDSAG
jgi:glycerophosphoryl diester phosphodiesterase